MQNSELALVGDIGGTNCRLALAMRGVLLRDSLRVFKISDFPDLKTIALNYLAEKNSEVASACLAVAAPLKNDTVKFTNYHWQFSIAQLQADLKLPTLHVINDFAAVGWSLPHLRGDQLEQIGEGYPEPKATRVALGPGTGFGASLVVTDNEKHIVLPTESGHKSLAPSTPLELEIFGWILGNGEQITCEQLLSGPGLQRLYRALTALRGKSAAVLSAVDIQQRAITGEDPIATQALTTFCELLGTAARDQALGCLAQGGIFIAGGIVPQFIPFLRSSGFRERFEDSHTMRALLTPIPTYVIVEEFPGLVGTAAFSHSARLAKK